MTRTQKINKNQNNDQSAKSQVSSCFSAKEKSPRGNSCMVRWRGPVTPLKGDGLQLHGAAAGRDGGLVVAVQVEQLGRIVVPVAD